MKTLETQHDIRHIRAGFKQRQIRFIFVTCLLSLLTLALCIAALLLGNTLYSLDSVVRVLLGESIEGATFTIGTLRLPRMLAGLLVGFAFGMAGSTFQTMLGNPLASPDIIGVTSGSSVAAVFCLLVLRTSSYVVSLAAVLCGLLVATLIYVLSRGGSFSGGRLILIGIGVQAMLNAVVSFLLQKASQYDVPGALRWLSGSLSGIRMTQIPTLLTIVVLFGCLLLILGRSLRLFELGEQSAVALGVRTDRIRMLLIVSAVFLLAFSTAVTGPIAFVAFLAGPIATRLVGKGASNQLPAGLVGAVLVLGADLMGQFAFDTRFPVGIITGILGAPYLLFLLIQMNRKGGAA